MGTGLTWQTESWTSLSFFLLVPNSSNIINIHVELNFILFITRVGDPDPNFEKARIRTLNFIQKKLEKIRWSYFKTSQIYWLFSTIRSIEKKRDKFFFLLNFCPGSGFLGSDLDTGFFRGSESDTDFFRRSKSESVFSLESLNGKKCYIAVESLK